MTKRKRSIFYRPRLRATRCRLADPLAPLRYWLVRLETLYELVHTQENQADASGSRTGPGFCCQPAQENSWLQPSLHETAGPTEVGFEIDDQSDGDEPTDDTPVPTTPLCGNTPPWAEYWFAVPEQLNPGELTSEECFDLLACLGSILRSRAYAYVWRFINGSSLLKIFPKRKRCWHPSKSWEALLSQYEPVLCWAVKTFERWGVVYADLALSERGIGDWRQRAAQLLPETELANPKYRNRVEIQSLARQVHDLWAELDATDLVVALANKSLLLACEGFETLHATSQHHKALRQLNTSLDWWQDELAYCHDWLYQHRETFFLCSAYIQAVSAGFRRGLINDCDLFMTAAKYAAMLDALEMSEGIRLSAFNLSSKPVSLLSEVVMSQSNRSQPQTDAFPRSELEQLCLAAASSVEAPPKTLKWESPDTRYVAYLLVVQSTVVLRFFTRTGSEATVLEGEPICLAGVETILGEHGLAIIPLEKLLQTSDDLYLDVGRPPTRWCPVRRQLLD